MLTELSGNTADTVAQSSTPSASLISLVQRILTSGVNTRIVVADLGDVIILPKRGEYHSTIENMPAFCTAPRTKFEIHLLTDSESTTITVAGKDIKDLLWQAAFHAHQDRLIGDCSENDVIQFKRWPNLTRLPVTPNTARICALLTRHPTSITLVRRVLDIDRDEVNQVISAAFSAGIVNTISRGPSLVSSELAVAEVKPEQTQKAGLWHSLFAKISSL